MDQSPGFFSSGPKRFAPEAELTPLERSTQPDALMSLFMRVQTIDGPRTVIASNVTVAAASRISEALALAGHYAEFVDQCSRRESIPELVVRRKRERLPKIHQLDRTARQVANR